MITTKSFKPALSTSRRMFLAAVALVAMVAPSRAQTYPSQNITFVVAFAAGGIADVVARYIGLKLSERLGQPVVIENRGGAGGNLAAKNVSAAAPDGYTILATTSALAVSEIATKNKGFSVNDFTTVALAAFSPDVLAVHPSNPAKDLRDFIATAKEKSFTYGSAGVGTGPHIGAEYFFREVANVKAVHVPFTGGAPAVAAAIGNHIDGVVLTLPTVTPQIKQGGLRGLGLSGRTRNSAVPDVPTYEEMGFRGVNTGSWVGFFAPAKTPEAIVTRLNAAINEILKTDEAQEKLKSVGFEALIKTQPEAAADFRNDVDTWGKMTRAVGLAAE